MTGQTDDYEAAAKFASYQSDEYRINTGHGVELAFLAGCAHAKANPEPEVVALVEALQACLSNELEWWETAEAALANYRKAKGL